MKKCRNCGSENIVIYKNGVLAPFFMYKVYGIFNMTLAQSFKEKIANSKNPYKVLIAKIIYFMVNNLPKIKHVFNSYIYQKVDIRCCKDCHFIGPDKEYTFEELLPLYAQYRSDIYNKERIAFEPDYIHIANLVGKSKSELKERISNMDAMIEQYAKNINMVADWGGGEGKFIPNSLKNKEVYIIDVSNEPLVDIKYKRIDTPKDIIFDYIQINHVLEHVSSPYKFLANILKYLKNDGYLYLEVPRDADDNRILNLIDGNGIHSIHEHLNLYQKKSLMALTQSLGLKMITCEHKQLSLKDGFINQMDIVCGLFKKNN